MLFAQSSPTYAGPVICASRTVVLLDHLRVPYQVLPGSELPPSVAAIWASGREHAALIWPTDAGHWSAFADLPARVCNSDELDKLVAQLGGRWEDELDGIRCDERGRRLLPFDLNETILGLWSEAYIRERGGGGSRNTMLRTYYAVRPVLPRSMQIAMRRAFARVQERTTFPRWPFEPALHDLFDRMLAYVAAAVGEEVPYLLPWPNGARWALVLTHDVEHAAGCDRVPEVAALERSVGLRSSWNFVPRRYEVPEMLLSTLHRDGFEVGVHGLYHDGRDLAPETFAERMPVMQAMGREWGAVGFRSPATLRNWELMPQLGFDYDSSYPDTDPYEPQAGGCCSILPFFNRNIVELPITLPQDHTLFTILRRDGAGAWIEKAEAIRERGGMALLITHPDYMDPDALAAYRDFLVRFADANDVWRALPRDVSAWWRRRAGSLPVRENGGWRVEGAAAGEASVAFAAPG